MATHGAPMAASQLPCPAPRSCPSIAANAGAGVHKSQQSHDSGTYLDWTPEPESPPAGDFVTVVSVEGGGVAGPVPMERTTPFVTVLSIGPTATSAAAAPMPAVVHVEGRPRALPDGAEEVSVYRLPGERLGFGLKFEGAGGGGVMGAPGDAVRRLLIQSCAPESPASRVACSWGPLGEGDEILEIDQVAVNTLTKAECVHAMKESKVVMRLVVRGGGARGRPAGSVGPVVCGELKKAVTTSPPPPIPPRKSRAGSTGSAPPSPPAADPATASSASNGPASTHGDADAQSLTSLTNGSSDAEHEKQPLSR